MSHFNSNGGSTENMNFNNTTTNNDKDNDNNDNANDTATFEALMQELERKPPTSASHLDKQAPQLQYQHQYQHHNQYKHQYQPQNATNNTGPSIDSTYSLFDWDSLQRELGQQQHPQQHPQQYPQPLPSHLTADQLLDLIGETPTLYQQQLPQDHQQQQHQNNQQQQQQQQQQAYQQHSQPWSAGPRPNYVDTSVGVGVRSNETTPSVFTFSAEDIINSQLNSALAHSSQPNNDHINLNLTSSLDNIISPTSAGPRIKIEDTDSPGLGFYSDSIDARNMQFLNNAPTLDIINPNEVPLLDMRHLNENEEENVLNSPIVEATAKQEFKFKDDFTGEGNNVNIQGITITPSLEAALFTSPSPSPTGNITNGIGIGTGTGTSARASPTLLTVPTTDVDHGKMRRGRQRLHSISNSTSKSRSGSHSHSHSRSRSRSGSCSSSAWSSPGSVTGSEWGVDDGEGSDYDYAYDDGSSSWERSISSRRGSNASSYSVHSQFSNAADTADANEYNYNYPSPSAPVPITITTENHPVSDFEDVEEDYDVDEEVDEDDVGDDDSAKRYVCDTCGKRFTRPYNLKSHQRTHTNDRPYPCRKCGKRFARQHDRKRHEDLHSGEKKFQCKGTLPTSGEWGCMKRFARTDALRRHFGTENGKECIRPLVVAMIGEGYGESWENEGLKVAMENAISVMKATYPDNKSRAGKSRRKKKAQN